MRAGISHSSTIIHVHVGWCIIAYPLVLARSPCTHSSDAPACLSRLMIWLRSLSWLCIIAGCIVILSLMLLIRSADPDPPDVYPAPVAACPHPHHYHHDPHPPVIVIIIVYIIILSIIIIDVVLMGGNGSSTVIATGVVGGCCVGGSTSYPMIAQRTYQSLDRWRQCCARVCGPRGKRLVS